MNRDLSDIPLVQRAEELADEAQGRLHAGIEASKSTLRHIQDDALARARAAGREADAVLHDNPWRAVGLAAGIGLLLGLLMRRR